MNLADQLWSEVENESQTTRRVLERMPADKLAWKPHPKSFSLGQLALHIASVPGNVAAGATADSFEAPGFHQAQPQSIQEIMDMFSKSLINAREALRGMSDSRLAAIWSLTQNGKPILSMPRIAFLRSVMMNHLYHHRGQLSVYLRLLDVPVPSIYGPSADENPFA